MITVETFRIRNGSLVEVGDWVGVVVDQAGPNVLVTMPDRQFAWIHRNDIEAGKVVR